MIKIIKRDGRIVEYDRSKIYNAIQKAFNANNVHIDVDAITAAVEEKLGVYLSYAEVDIENVQKTIVGAIKSAGYPEVAKSFNSYREQRSKSRQKRDRMLAVIKEISQESDRENANVGNGPSSKMLQFAETATRKYTNLLLLDKEVMEAIEGNLLYPHDLSWMPTGSTTCCHIPFNKLLTDGFNTGHGYLRTPQSIGTAMSLAAIAFQSNQNDQHGGQASAFFDTELAPFVKRDYENRKRKLVKLFAKANVELTNEKLEELAWAETEKATEQACEAFVHNMNTMHCLPYNEKIWVYDCIENDILLIPIGEFCEKFEENRYYAFSLNTESLKTELKLITAAEKKDNHRRMVNLTSKSGGKVCTTDNHRILNYSKDYKAIENKMPENVTHLLSPRGFSYNKVKNDICLEEYGTKYSNTRYLEDHIVISEEFAELAGYYVADGSITGNDSTLVFTVCDKISKAHLDKLMSLVFGVEFSSHTTSYEKGIKDIRYSVGARISKMFKTKFGNSSHTKKIPIEIMFAPHDIQISFINAYSHCDGAHKDYYLELSSVSELLIAQLNFMIMNMGELPYISEKNGISKFNNKEYKMYNLSLGSMPCERIGIKLNEYKDIEYPRYDLSFIRGSKEITHIAPRRHTDAVRYHEITSETRYSNLFKVDIENVDISNSDEMYVYDITVSDNENFLTKDCIFVHNSRAGAQVPFTSVNIGTDTSKEARLITKCLLEAYNAGLGHGEQPLFPNIIFKVKNGVNYEEGTPNHDLLQLAYKVTANRLYPIYNFQDCTLNKDFPVDVPSMGCRTRISWDRHLPADQQTVVGRGNLSFTSINLPGLTLDVLSHKDNLFDCIIDDDFDEIMEKYDIQLPEEVNSIIVREFFIELNDMIELAAKQLYNRYKSQAVYKKRDFPFLMNGVWIGSENLDDDDEVREVLKHGTLGIGFIGLAETLTGLCGKHHGEDETANKLGLEIVRYMAKKINDECSELYDMNYALLATPAEGLTGKFLNKDKELYGEVKGITDKDWYTNSMHLPVEFENDYAHKIYIEGQYIKYLTGGNITYVELSSSPVNNPEAVEAIVKMMHDADIALGAINFPCDRCLDCGYSGTIETDECPNCGKTKISRIRRVTGYLAPIENFNEAKKAEALHRVKHDKVYNEKEVI